MVRSIWYPCVCGALTGSIHQPRPSAGAWGNLASHPRPSSEGNRVVESVVPCRFAASGRCTSGAEHIRDQSREAGTYRFCVGVGESATYTISVSPAMYKNWVCHSIPMLSSQAKLTFRMLTLKQIVSQIRSEDWFVAIDRKDAYFHISILPQHRKYLRFAFRAEAYQYRVLPFGLALSPRTFTKCVDAALVPWGSKYSIISTTG